MKKLNKIVLGLLLAISVFFLSTAPVLASTVNVPFFGDVSSDGVAIPIFGIILGLIDGFNPCAMWILLFLISMMIGMEDRKRMWTLGFTFIFVSAITYFAFMALWLNTLMFIGTKVAITIAVGVFGVVGGVWNIRAYLKQRKEDDGCEIQDEKSRFKTIEKIKKITKEEHLYFAIVGISVLAVSVNILELMCSAGLPLMYTTILEEQALSTATSYGYMLIYILAFMFDDILIFTIAMVTFKVTGISTKYTKYSHLIGGLLLFIMGILLIFAPEVLMFG